jgi:hypothetical protein
MLRDPDQSAAFRRNAVQFAVLTLLFLIGLWLLRLPTPAFLATAAAIVALLGARIWGPGELDSAQEYALMVATEFPRQAISAIANDSGQWHGWQQAGVRTDLLIALTPSTADTAAVELRRTARPQATPMAILLVALTSAAGTAALSIIAVPSCLRVSPTAAALLAVLAAATITNRAVIWMLNGRQRRILRAHFSANPQRSVAAELTALLAPAEQARRTALAVFLNAMSGAAPLRRSPLAIALILLRHAVLGAAAMVWIFGLVASC